MITLPQSEFDYKLDMSIVPNNRRVILWAADRIKKKDYWITWRMFNDRLVYSEIYFRNEEDYIMAKLRFGS